MEQPSSLSQGAFLFVPSEFSLSKYRAMRKRKKLDIQIFKWETAYERVWKTISQEVDEINKQLFSKVVKDLVEQLKKGHSNYTVDEEVIPCQILLTGSNLPDHEVLLSTFVYDIKTQITPYVASLWSWNCSNIRSLLFNLVSQIMPLNRFRPRIDNTTMLEEPTNEVFQKRYLSCNLLLTQFNLSTLAAWYDTEFSADSMQKPAIVIIIPDFESFVPSVIGDFILLLSTYVSKIPFLLVFGVATTPVSVYQNLPRKALAKLVIQIFKSEQSPPVLNNVIENVLLSEKCPFRLGEKCMNFLTDIFLFHSFSVHAFVQGYRYCILEHFFKRDHFALCCNLSEVSEQVDLLSSEELDNLRRVFSFKKYVEGRDKLERKLLLLNDTHTRKVIKKMITDLLEHSRDFYYGLKLLHILTSDLPNNPLGRNLREYYCKCLACNVEDSNEYKECMKLLEMQSKNELIPKVNSLVAVLKPGNGDNSNPTEASAKLKNILVKLEEFNEKFSAFVDITTEDGTQQKMANLGDSFEELRKNFLTYIHEGVVKAVLFPPNNLPLREAIYFDDLSAVRRRISATPRSAIHLALNNPQCFLICKCCVVSGSDEILPSLPDLSIAYKIHLEHNKIINMYDWLQSFAAIVKESEVPSEEEEKEIQARFTKAISELQFLGFIKPSKVKTDHVARLTWETA